MIGMIRLAQAGRGLLAGVALFVPLAHARAAKCPTATVSGRFVEAARLCEGAPVAASQPTRAYVPVEVANRESVSVSMPGYRQRLVAAAQETRARGGAAAAPALVTAIAHRYRINPRLLASMMRTESAGRMGAISNKGALGLMQVMPGTARSMGVRDPKAMLTNPVLAMSTGAAYLKRLQAQFGNDVPSVVAAYNAGPGAVRRYKGIPRYRETQGYVRKVMGGYAGRAE